MPTSLDKILNSQFVMIGLAGLAFLIALWLVIVIVRMMTGGRLRFNGGRTRQARLGIVDAFDLDRQRQLIIVRRDNTEHLIMIGGPNDLVIESEIVRVEARDNRRSTDKPEGFADRIPAPTMVTDESPSAAEEPLLPMPLPPVAVQVTDRSRRPVEVVTQQVEPVPEPMAPRAPTFPLPRRPAPSEPIRRPPPPLPESASRLDETRPVPGPRPALPVAAPPAPSQTPAPSEPSSTQFEATAPLAPDAFPAPPPIPPQALPPIVPTQGTDVPPRPARPPPPSFLKPLPPRPPIRPLRRATPVAPGAPAAAGPSPTSVPAAPSTQTPEAASPPVDPPASPIPSPAHTPQPAAETVAAPAAQEVPPPVAHEALPLSPANEPAVPPKTDKAEDQNALESLEEEMAKLLGRG